MIRKFILASAIALASTTSQAAEIVGLYNTGVKNCGSGDPCSGAGGGQKKGSGADLHWDLAGAPQAFTGNPINNLWATNASSAASRWITPTTNGNATLDPSSDGLYSYFTTFSLAGFNAATASFSGRFLVDNRVDSITLNGNTINGSGGSFGANSWSNFSALSGFASGTNTLVFNVRNIAQVSGNPSGLRVEFLQSAVSAVPEPATWAMMILGFGVVGAAMRRRSQAVRTTVSFA